MATPLGSLLAAQPHGSAAGCWPRRGEGQGCATWVPGHPRPHRSDPARTHRPRSGSQPLAGAQAQEAGGDAAPTRCGTSRPCCGVMAPPRCAPMGAAAWPVQHRSPAVPPAWHDAGRRPLPPLLLARCPGPTTAALGSAPRSSSGFCWAQIWTRGAQGGGGGRASAAKQPPGKAPLTPLDP